MSLQLEAIERAAMEDLLAAAPPALRETLAIRRENVGGALVSIAGALPASAIVVNRTIGLGLEAPATRDAVERIAALYAEAGVARYFVHVHPEARPPELRHSLGEAGLERARSWVKFTRGREAPPEASTDLTVREAGPQDATAFGRIASAAFDLGEAAMLCPGALIGRPGWHLYMTFEGATPAGTGALFVRDGIGWCDWGATAPAFRRRGSQSALLRQRILHALDLGCRMVVTATGEAVEGDPQHSYKNIVRMGFRPAYVRENYAPPKR